MKWFRSRDSYDGEWSYYIPYEVAGFAGQTVYVTGVDSAPTVTLSDGSNGTMTQVLGEDGQLTNVYKYTFADEVREGTTFSISGTNLNGVSEFDTSKPLYDAAKSEWKEYSVPITEVTIKLELPGPNAYVWFVKDDQTTQSTQTYKDGDTFTYNLTEYDGFYVGWDQNNIGNITETQGNEVIRNAFKKYESPVFIVGGTYTSGVHRSGIWADANSTGDLSLNIPEGTFKKDENTRYISATFYDYYSDVELSGTNRGKLTEPFDKNNGSADKIQASTFNLAVSDYFSGQLTSKKPLYFGEFTGTDPDYYNFEMGTNNGSGGYNGKGAHQGLVDNTLDAAGNVTMDTVELPYFNKEFLRGDNSKNEAIGYVFEDVAFPFQKNEDDYWEFDSLDAAQTLRMKKDGDTYPVIFVLKPCFLNEYSAIVNTDNTPIKEPLSVDLLSNNLFQEWFSDINNTPFSLVPLAVKSDYDISYRISRQSGVFTLHDTRQPLNYSWIQTNIGGETFGITLKINPNKVDEINQHLIALNVTKKSIYGSSHKEWDELCEKIVKNIKLL